MPVEIFVFMVLGTVLLFSMFVRWVVVESESAREIEELRRHLDGLSGPTEKEPTPVEKILLFGDTFEEVAKKVRDRITPKIRICQGVTLQKKTGKYTAILERDMVWDHYGMRLI